MIPPATATDVLCTELLAVLDREIALLECRGEQLAELYRAILQRDEAAMDPLLSQMEATQRQQESVDVRLASARAALANALGVEPRGLKLGALMRRVQGHWAAAIDYRRQQIVRLVEKVRRRHLEAAFLLSQCAEINRALLASLFPRNEPVTLYGAGGATAWRPETGLVDAES